MDKLVYSKPTSFIQVLAFLKANIDELMFSVYVLLPIDVVICKHLPEILLAFAFLGNGITAYLNAYSIDAIKFEILLSLMITYLF